MEAIFEVFNLLNTDNFRDPSSTWTSEHDELT